MSELQLHDLDQRRRQVETFIHLLTLGSGGRSGNISRALRRLAECSIWSRLTGKRLLQPTSRSN